MLEIRNINVKYSENYILKNLSTSVDKMSNNVLGVLGKNGAGKTTLFNTLFGALNFTGEILWEGKKLDRENIAYLETTNYFYPYITGKEYLNYKEEGKELLILQTCWPLGTDWKRLLIFAERV